MSQRFALVRHNLDPLDVEKLRRAFLGLPGLAPYDADAVCNDGAGILCRGFATDHATTLQAKLKAEGVDAEIIDETTLPALPPPKIIRRVEIKPEALFVEDLVRGMMPVEWARVRLIAAGSIRLTQVTRKYVETEETHPRHIHVGHLSVQVTEGSSGYVSKEKVDWFLRAEILLADSPVRYSIEAERFNFIPLGEGVTRDLSGNFCLLVRGLVTHAPKAILNQGAAAIAADPPEFMYYPRKSAYYDEITWHLWKAQSAAG